MASDHISKENFLNVLHLPTFLLTIGFPVYWLELYVISIREANTSLLAPILFLIVTIWITLSERLYLIELCKSFIKNLVSLNLFNRFWLILCCLIAFGILTIAFAASTFPPHFIQEHDALVYHITMPRQHLLLNSFKHIPWSSADLYLLPLNFALAPYWLATELPNKLPQFLFMLGLLGVCANVLRNLFQGNFISRCLLVFAIVGSHGIAIQMGTAMMDIVMVYLFIAAIDSFIGRRYFLCVVEAVFFFYSKSFIPPQMIVILLTLILIIFLLKKCGFKLNVSWPDKHVICKLCAYFIVLSIFIGGPFLGKSTYYTGTPIYPFGVGFVSTRSDLMVNEIRRNSLEENIAIDLKNKDNYGYGRGSRAFLKYLAFFAVPTKDVNNEFDYPAGLPFLLFLGPFAYLVLKDFKNKKIRLIPLFAIVYWLSWWAVGSQQMRFLYIPIILVFLVVLSRPKFATVIFKTVIILSLGLTFISVFRAHKNDFGKSAYEVLRQEDKALLSLGKSFQKGEDPVIIQNYLPAFADYPVDVRDVYSHFIIERR